MAERSDVQIEIKFLWGIVTIRRQIEIGKVDPTEIPVEDGELSHTVFHSVTIKKDRLQVYTDDQKYLGTNKHELIKEEINKHKITPPKRRFIQIIQALTGYSRGYIYIAPEN